MSEERHLTTPVESESMPRGIPYIIGNEAAERFSFYGMKGILVIFMTKYLLDSEGAISPMEQADAIGWYHIFTTAVYGLPILGALVSDWLFGKYKTILSLSIVYCMGHLALALDETRMGLVLGLTLIAVGSGGIKPCVSAHVGDQFGHKNQGLLQRVFGWFYFSINFGSTLSTLLTPWLLQHYGPSVAFGVPGALMLLATWTFWLGRKVFVHIPAGGSKFVKETFSREGISALLKLSIIYVFVAPFWSLFDQTGSSWVLQADRMDRHLFGFEWLPSQIQAINPVLVMAFIPLFSYGIYPAINRVFTLTPLRKIGIGLFVAAAAFAPVAIAESRLLAGHQVSIAWQLGAYTIITAAEIMVSITCLEFSYTQAPTKMKSFVMAFFLSSVALGNSFTSAVNFFIQNPDGSSKLAGASYFWFFSGVMLVTALLFVPAAMMYKPKSYIQGKEALDETEAEAQEEGIAVKVGAEPEPQPQNA